MRIASVSAVTAAALLFAAASAPADNPAFPAKKLTGWEEEQHWPGPGVEASFNGRDVTVRFKDRTELTVYMSDPVDFGKRVRPHLVVKAALDDGMRLDLFGKTPGDVCGRLVDDREEDGYRLLRYELFNARTSFNQLTFRTGLKTGSLIIAGMTLVEGDAAAVKAPGTGDFCRPAEQFVKTGLAPLGVPSEAKDWPARREEIRKLWMTALGASPEPRPALDAKELSREEFEDYTRLKVRFVSEGPDTIDAWVLVPKTGEPNPGPFPAVVCLHPTTQQRGDEMVGLFGRGDVAHAVQLVKEGYVTLAFNCYIMKADTPEARKIGDQVKALADRRPGWTGLGKMVYDASRAVDYLETLANVDKTRIGVIGHSLGGKQAMFAAAFEPRFACAVSSEGGVGMTFSNWTDPWYLTEKFKPRIGELEGHQVLALAAPRPVLVIGGDSADGEKGRPFIDEAGAVYRLLGAADKLALFNHKTGHRFPYAAQAEASRWLAKHLKK
jgi:dienelactone hydrolase